MRGCDRSAWLSQAAHQKLLVHYKRIPTALHAPTTSRRRRPNLLVRHDACIFAGDVRLRKPMYVRFFLLAGRMLAEGNHTRPPTRKEVEGEWERDTSARPGTDEVGAGGPTCCLSTFLCSLFLCSLFLCSVRCESPCHRSIVIITVPAAADYLVADSA